MIFGYRREYFSLETLKNMFQVVEMKCGLGPKGNGYQDTHFG